METLITEADQFHLIHKILSRQDPSFRWAHDGRLAEERPEMVYYWPKYKSTLWTMLYLTDLNALPDDPRLQHALDLLEAHFYSPANSIFDLGPKGHFPIPCLNGNLLHLHFYFRRQLTPEIDGVINFFDTYQRFDDGGFKTPGTYPYHSNKACYGGHTCYWGIVNLLKGLSSIPLHLRTSSSSRLLGNCIEFILVHAVCFSSHTPAELLHPDLGDLTFPELVRVDFLGILWLLKKEGVIDPRLKPAIDRLRAKMNPDVTWNLEAPINSLITPAGAKGQPNPFITARAREVLEFYS